MTQSDTILKVVFFLYVWICKSMTNFISYNKYQKVYMSITYYTGKATLFYKLLSLLPFFKMKKKSY